MENVKIRFVIDGYGTIDAELYPEIAPETVKNFVSLIESGFFSGKIFHRIISGFMIQGGGYDADFNHYDVPSIRGEFAANGFSGNDLKHTRGVLSMARTSDPNSASSQFFIMHENAPHLDGQYAAFGKVTEGIETVDKIAEVRTDFRDCPLYPIVITKASVIK